MFGNENNGNYPNYNGYSGYDDNGYNQFQNNGYMNNEYDPNGYMNNGYNQPYNNGANYDAYGNAYNQEFTQDYNNYGQQQTYMNDAYMNSDMGMQQQSMGYDQYYDNNQVTAQIAVPPAYDETQAMQPMLPALPGYDYEQQTTTYSPLEEYYTDGNYTVNPIQPGNSHALLGKVIAMAGVIVIGLLCGMLTDSALKNFWARNIESDSIIIVSAKVFAIIIYVYLASVLHVLIHEVGHMIGGLVTDYSSVSFRIYNRVFVKDGRKTRIKKQNVPGTAGECIMMPPEIVNGKYPFMLYSLGGIILNAITSLAALVLFTKVSLFKAYPYSMMCVIFAIIGLITILYNGIPLIINGIPNDGYTIMHMVKNKDARIAVHSHLLINAYLSRGGRYSDIPFEQFYKNAGGNYSGHLWVKVKLMEYKWNLEHIDFAKAAECLNSLDYCYKKLPRIYQYRINTEKLFLEIMGNNDPEIVQRLYSNDIKNYLEDTIGTMSSVRIMMAYETCVTHNMKQANKYYNLLKNLSKSEPLKGESDLELMLGMYIYESYFGVN